MRQLAIPSLTAPKLRFFRSEFFKTLLPPTAHTILIAALFCIALVSPALGQIVGPNVELRASGQGDFTKFWLPHTAGIREDLGGMLGYLEAQNISNESLDGVVFYAEYFDAEGRFCFSLVLSREKRPERLGPIASRQIEPFFSSTTGLFIASDPSQVKLYLVQQTITSQSSPPQRWNVPIRAPVTIAGSMQIEEKLQLGPEFTFTNRPVADLLLAKVLVDQRGSPHNVEVLQAANDQLKNWFLNFVRQRVPFYPSTVSGIPRQGEVLVLVRAATLVPQTGLQDSDREPRTAPWVKSYVTALKNTDVPPLMNLLFTRPPNKVRQNSKLVDTPAAPPGLYDILNPLGDWSDQAYRWVRDESMPNHLRRELM